MQRRKIWTGVLVAVFAVVLGLAAMALTACGGHTFASTWKSDETGHWHACTDEGCTDTQDYAEHTFGKPITVKSATHTEDGEQVSQCTVCGYEKRESIAATGHTYAETWEYNAENHWHEATCYCGKENNEKSDLAAHDFDVEVTRAATCKKTGLKTYTCACGYSKTEDIPIDPDAHTYGDGVETRAATCSAEGEMTYTCIDCEHERMEPIAIDPDAHDWGLWTPKADGAQHTRTCKHNSEHVETGEHVMEDLQWRSDDESHYHVCDVCSAKFDETAHSMETETWSDDGTNHYHVCDVCTEHYDVTPHEGTAYESAGEEGHYHVCATCNENYNLTPHVWDTDSYSRCTTCEYDSGYTHGLKYRYESGGYSVAGYGTAGSAQDIIVPATYDDGTNGTASVIAIASGALTRQSDLRSLDLPASVKTIGTNGVMVSGSAEAALDRLVLRGVETIAQGAFAYWESIGEIYLPATLKSVAGLAFSTVPATKVYYEGTADEWSAVTISSSGNEVLTSRAPTNNYNIDGGYTQGLTYSYQDGGYIVTGFGSAQGVNDLIVPATYDDGTHGELAVTAIGGGAFTHTPLRSVELPESVTTVNTNAFFTSADGNYQMEKVILKGVVTLMGGSFAHWKSIGELYLSADLAKINTNVFLGAQIEAIYYEGSSGQWSALMAATDNVSNGNLKSVTPTYNYSF